MRKWKDVAENSEDCVCYSYSFESEREKQKKESSETAQDISANRSQVMFHP
jgi:hypothetical protein